MPSLRSRLAAVQRDTYALALAARDPRVPWYARALLALVVAYALSPIDFIPDFIPVLGYLDDALLLPLGLLLVRRLIPPAVLEEHRRAAAAALEGPGRRHAGLFIVLAVWLALAALAIVIAWRITA